MTGKWTPGPWVVVVGDDDDVTVCAFEGDPRDGIMSDVICEITSINDVSDPHLIAAAPTMADAIAGYFSAKAALAEFERENPNDSTSNWERLFEARCAAEDQLQAALSQALGEGE